ncbi:hypothetical protein M9Y10_028563 [Tritrichomonas musculus]|uniref:Uncharacterized protein n=1 Tax=Tritrichomonas musculus TaxID=1915356 RepID=A0ABR2KJP9_9EUKA
MTDSDQTRTKITLKDSSGTSEGAEIPQKPLVNVSVPFVDQQNQNLQNNVETNNILFNKMFVQKVPPGYIAELKSAVSILARRKNALQEEYKKIKSNTIRSSEIAFIRSQTQYVHSQNSLIQIQDLMSRYTETMRNNSALKALCVNLEKKISYEEHRRSSFIEEMHLLENTYNLNESVHLEPPKLNQPDDSIGRAEQLEIQRLINRLQILHNQLREVQSEPDYETNTIAFKEIVKSIEMKSNLRQVGTKELKEEIDNLQQTLNHSNDMIDMIISENSKKRRKMEAKSQQYYEEEKNMAEKFQNQIQNYKEKSIKDNKKYDSLRSKLEKIQSDNQSIFKEIDRINDLPKPRKIIPIADNNIEEDMNDNDDEESSESDKYDESQFNQTNQQLVFTLNQQIYQLRSEIHDLNQQYFFLKTNVNDSQNQKLKQIRSLNEKYQKNLERIEKIRLEKKVAPTDQDKEEADSIAKILDKIHGSIFEINSSLIGDNQ